MSRNFAGLFCALRRVKAAALLLALLVPAAAVPAAAQGTYTIQPGDVLQIEVLEDPGLNRSALVLPDGSISFPLAGTVRVGGRSVDDARAALTAGIASNFAAPPNVTISVTNIAPPPPSAAAAAALEPTISIYILGEAANPGKKEIAPGTTLLQFLAESGGLTRFAATKRIQLRRTGSAGAEQVYLFNFKAVQAGGAQRSQIVLVPGDVIVVPERRLFE